MQLDTNPLKNQYPIVVRIAGLSGNGIIIITFLSFPRFLAEAGLEQVEQIIIENIDIPQTQQIDNIPPPARPSIPVPTDDEDIADDLTLDDLDFDDFEAWDAPPQPTVSVSSDSKIMTGVAVDTLSNSSSSRNQLKSAIP